MHTLLGHTAEIVSLDFDTQGQRIITGSFDNTVKVRYIVIIVFCGIYSNRLAFGRFGTSETVVVFTHLQVIRAK